jgi:hypothetical protein
MVLFMEKHYQIAHGGELEISGFFTKHIGQHHEQYFMVFLSLSLQMKGNALN